MYKRKERSFQKTRMQNTSLRLEILKDAFVIAADNYKDNVRILSAYDDKAQKMVTLAGLFLTVPFALIKPDSISTVRNLIGLNGMFTFAGVVGLFMVCVILCLLSMRVGKIPAPLGLNDAFSMTVDLLQLPDNGLTNDIQERYCNQKLLIWAGCINAQDTVASKKWRLVFAAQLILGIAILAIGFLFVDLIYVVLMVEPLPPGG